MDISVTAAWKLIRLCFVHYRKGRFYTHSNQLFRLGRTRVGQKSKGERIWIPTSLLKTQSVRYLAGACYGDACQDVIITHLKACSRHFIYLSTRDAESLEEFDHWDRCSCVQAARFIGTAGETMELGVLVTSAHSAASMLKPSRRVEERNYR